MAMKNTSTSFGSLTKFLHWAVFILFIVQPTLIYWRRSLPEGHAWSMDMIMTHKSLGFVVLALAVMMLFWRHMGTRPSLGVLPTWERNLARFTHLGLYIVMLAMPITGYMMSSYSPYGVFFFGYPVPTFVEQSKDMGALFHDIHEYVSYAAGVFVTLHVVGALKHHFVDKNNILRRMLPF